jgi:molybdopterin/thiamine biosynthesis adenylyltransferase/rhodanese-related sulfurtransferase
MTNNSSLSPQELSRYSRHLAIPEFGIVGQEKLKAATVLVIGAGGLGSPLLLYLTAAGVGHIGIVDFDVVDDSNLQRQVLYTVDDIGKSKAHTAKERLKALNPHVKFTVYNKAFTKENAMEIIKDYDLVADGSDNFPTRYLVNDACVLANKVNVYAAIFRFEGQVSVFNFENEDGSRGPNYRDLFPSPPLPGMVPSCAEGGVLGILPGIIGSMQATEVIKIITGVGEPLVGRFFLFDAAGFISRTLKIKKNPEVSITELIDYEAFCGIVPIDPDEVKEITVEEFENWKKEKIDFQLIDVRETYEFEINNLGGELIPFAEIPKALNRIAKHKKVLIHCLSGKRSAAAIMELQRLGGFDNLYSLRGGIIATEK